MFPLFQDLSGERQRFGFLLGQRDKETLDDILPLAIVFEIVGWHPAVVIVFDVVAEDGQKVLLIAVIGLYMADHVQLLDASLVLEEVEKHFRRSLTLEKLRRVVRVGRVETGHGDDGQRIGDTESARMVDVVDFNAVRLARRFLVDELKTVVVIEFDVEDEIDDAVDEFRLIGTVGTHDKNRPVLGVSVDFTENQSFVS